MQSRGCVKSRLRRDGIMRFGGVIRSHPSPKVSEGDLAKRVLRRYPGPSTMIRRVVIFFSGARLKFRFKPWAHTAAVDGTSQSDCSLRECRR